MDVNRHLSLLTPLNPVYARGLASRNQHEFIAYDTTAYELKE